MLTVDQVSEILKEEKIAIGMPEWIPENKNSGKIQLRTDMQCDLELPYTLELIIKTNTQSASKSGEVVILCDKNPVQRLSYMPDKKHHNSRNTKLPAHLKGKVLPARKTRIYTWEINKKLGWPPEGGDIKIAELVNEELSSFTDAINYFLEVSSINLWIPEINYQERLAV